MMHRFALLLCCLSLAACQPLRAPATEKATAMPDLKAVQARLAFSCAHEKDRLPALHPEADQLYRYARWLRQQQLRKEDPARYPLMARLYRIASAYDHYRANLELRAMLRAGRASSDAPVKEVVLLTQRLIALSNAGKPVRFNWHAR